LPHILHDSWNEIDRTVKMMQTLSDKAQKTRERILEAAARLFYQHGYNATGVEKVIKEAGVNKGNFYYYFKSKEELGVETLRWQQRNFAEQLLTNVPLGDDSPLQRMYDTLERMKQLVSSGSAECPIRGCYYGNFSLELSTASAPIRRELVSAFDRIRNYFADLIARAQAAGEVGAQIDPHVAAGMMFSLLEGAIIISKAAQNTREIDNALAFIRDYLGS
jgi:TetR/AcrR family transcriptional repressor of nem operon